MNDEVKRYLEPGNKNLILIYILYLGVIVHNLFPIIGVAFAYASLNHDDVRWRSHYVFAYRSFCFGFVGEITAIITALILIGPLIHMIVFVWFIVRSILGLQLLIQEAAHPNPLTLWIK